MPTPTPEELEVELVRGLPLDAGWRDRWQLAERSRLLIPTALAMRYVRSKAARRWTRDRELRAASLQRMTAIVAGTARAAEAQQLAREAVLEDAAYHELFLRPRALIHRRRFLGTHHLEDAMASGRGVVVSYCHLGPFGGAVTPVVPRFGPRAWLFVGEWMTSLPEAGAIGRYLERWRGLAQAARGRYLLTRPGARAAGVALLERGEVVCILFDLPGQTVTPWLGKPVELATGTARMAHAAGAIVIPVASRRVGGRVQSTFLPPIAARDHATPEALHVALAAVHERLILDQPEALESPLRNGSWESGATPQRWSNPA